MLNLLFYKTDSCQHQYQWLCRKVSYEQRPSSQMLCFRANVKKPYKSSPVHRNCSDNNYVYIHFAALSTYTKYCRYAVCILADKQSTELKLFFSASKIYQKSVSSTHIVEFTKFCVCTFSAGLKYGKFSLDFQSM